MEDTFAERVYLTLIGQLIGEGAVPGVENQFAVGAQCLELYSEMLDAYARVCERLGAGEDDLDVEIIINNLLRVAEELSLRMYHYGTQLG